MQVATFMYLPCNVQKSFICTHLERNILVCDLMDFISALHIHIYLKHVKREMI